MLLCGKGSIQNLIQVGLSEVVCFELCLFELLLGVA